jgi:hypothetical protein
MNNNRTYKTQAGSELPLLNLRGKDYLEVKYRLVWFREEHPDWTIQTEFVSITDHSALAKATILDGQSRVVSTSHKFENDKGFPDFLEKAETGAIGRALALVGYGTQFCADELDEGDRIVDSPASAVPRVTGTQRVSQSASSSDSAPQGLTRDSSLSGALPADAEGEAGVDPGAFKVPFGRKYRGKAVKDIPRHEIESYLAWLETEAEKKQAPLGFEVKLLKKAVELHYANVDSASASTA